MHSSARPILMTLALCALLAVPAAAWKSRLEGLVVPIAEAHEFADKGDRIVVEGVVQDSADARIFRIRDDTGDLYLRIPESLRREHGVPQRHERIRVAGRWTDAYLDKDIQGIHVQILERLGRDGARSGAPGPAVEPAPAPQTSPPAAASSDPSAPKKQVFAPRTSAAWKQRLGDARQRVLRAEREAQQANAEFARAVNAQGSEEAVDPAIAQRRKRTDAELAAARQEIPELVTAARSSGVDPKILEIYERATLRR